MFRRAIINRARTIICRSYFEVNADYSNPFNGEAEADNDKDKDKDKDKVNDENSVAKIIHCDASVVPGVLKSGSFAWLERNASGVISTKKFVYVPCVQDIKVLEGLACLDVVCTEKFQGSVVHLYTDCNQWLSKLISVKDGLGRGMTIEEVMNDPNKKEKDRLLYEVACAFVRVMEDHFLPDSAISLIYSSQNRVAHHFANAVRQYFKEKKNSDEEFNSEFEILEEHEMYQWVYGIIYDCNPDTLKKLNDAENAKKNLEQREYFDPANEERNEYSKELICIELDPSFVKGYIRKETVKELELDANNQFDVERGTELGSACKMVANALMARIVKTSKDCDLAIEAFYKALTEHRNPDRVKKLNEAEKDRVKKLNEAEKAKNDLEHQD